MPGVEAHQGETTVDESPAPSPPAPHTQEGEVSGQKEAPGGYHTEEEEEARRQKGTSVCVAPPLPAAPLLFSAKVMLACKLLLLLLALVIVVHTRGPLVRKTSSPQPFFPQHSLVTDFHTGDVGSLTERLLAADLSLVVYYAPWDRASQTLRWEVERAAQHHHEQIYFAAINCWQPGSECKSRYKIRKFPAIVLHIRTASGMETKAMAYGGLPEAAHLIRFLSRCLRPLTHVASHADLPRLQMDHGGVVLGFFDFTASLVPRGFTSYYLASMRWLQHEPAGAVAWGVVTNPRVAQTFALNASQAIHLVLWNTTLAFTNAAVSDSEAISSWVAKRLDETASWLHLSGDKSQALSRATQEGPTLLLFSPDNPYYTTNDPFTLLRELSLEYFNCNQSGRVSTLARYLGASRSRGRTHQRKVERACHTYLAEHLQLLHLSQQHYTAEGKTFHPDLLSTTVSYHSTKAICERCRLSWEAGGDCIPAREGSLVTEECANPNLQVKANLLHHVKSLMMVLSDSCREMVLQYTPWKDPLCCHKANTTNTSSSASPSPHLPLIKTQTGDKGVVGGQPDDHIERLQVRAGEEQCRRLFHGSLLGTLPFIKDQDAPLDITGKDMTEGKVVMLRGKMGLGCRTNKTLSFLALDSLHHQDVAERLGVNLSSLSSPPNTAALIVDVKREAHFILDASLSKHTLAAFILNYTHGLLDR
ncbi:Thioredoxin domain-containing protein 11 [Chionoecetes opilio]|uniref:Thioredoxin domain-containing protein 11 n=1 Tax=Chionoecetes opilio TaxID=41210 RepID=A0A8J5D2G4_CHIOP|nr:Thioredoxin domain-containing protein 11 [Chionoecetes opilio]